VAVKKIPTTPSPLNGAERVQQLRDWVSAAEGDGADKSALVLRLTHRDVATLKRHPSVHSDEIAFAPDGMRFLGVQVAEGGVADSALERVES
jgi:hypothetical protein